MPSVKHGVSKILKYQNIDNPFRTYKIRIIHNDKEKWLKK